MTEASAPQDAATKERSAVEKIVATKAYVDNPGLLPWYTADLEEPSDETNALFEEYCKVPLANIVPHIKQVRDEAFKVVRSISSGL